MTMTITKSGAWRLGIEVCGHYVQMAITYPVKKASRPEYVDASSKKEREEKIRIIDLKTQEAEDLLLTPEMKTGKVYDVQIDFGQADPADYGYQLMQGERIVDDPYAVAVRRAGEETINLFSIPDAAQMSSEDDVFEPVSIREMRLYKLHVKGFTKHPSSKVKAPGTFEGVLEKLDHIKALGINAIELMPVYDFVMTEKKNGSREPRRNYWGYGPARFMAVKPEYAKASDEAEAAFKHFVSELHKAGITVIMEIMFTGEETVEYQLSALRHWKRFYHIDGFHVSAWSSNIKELLDDPYLADTIILAENFDGSQDKSPYIRRAIVHDGFLENGRMYLRGDEHSCRAFMNDFLLAWPDQGKVNYMASHNGMTLMDMLSYEDKHNEDNGENNLDGTDWNISCNYGHEGLDCSENIRQIRMRQLKNAMAMTLFSEGIPMLMAGDECGRTQQGNNNAWCQDNDISWFDWSLPEKNKEILSFVKACLQLRQNSEALHTVNVPTFADKSGMGFPDLSVHGIEPWFTDHLDDTGVVGFMYANGKEIIYVAFNMSDRDIKLALPTIRGRKWQPVITTEAKLPQIAEDGRSISMLIHSVTILKSELSGDTK